MKTAQYVSKIKELEKHIESMVESLAQDVRQNVLIPYCEQHNLDFCSGMGTFFFTLPSGEHVNIDEISKKLDIVLSVALWESHLSLGDYIQSYNSTKGYYALNTKLYSKHDKPIGK